MTTRADERDKQQRILTAITVFIRQHGYSPSLEDLRRMCGISSRSVVLYQVRKLEAAGMVAFEPKIARSIRLRHDE